MQVMLAVILFWFEWPALIESHTHKMGNEGITGYLRKQTEAFYPGGRWLQDAQDAQEFGIWGCAAMPVKTRGARILRRRVV